MVIMSFMSQVCLVVLRFDNKLMISIINFYHNSTAYYFKNLSGNLIVYAVFNIENKGIERFYFC